ncbi:MAG: hypothetical protein ABIJ08_06970 [Nanoarchaeota archaeon]
MPPHHMFNPVIFGIELVYSVIILILCLMVYFKTKEMYELTKHKGIQFFRYAFLFFGLAYGARLVLYILIISQTIVCEFCRYGRDILPISNLIVAYFSTMAILFLAYSTVWRKINSEHFLMFSNILAMAISVIAFVSRSPFIISLIQLFLLIFTILIILKAHKKQKSNIRALYLLVVLFWLLNLFVLGPIMILLPGAEFIIPIVSILIFVAIYHKVLKWVK